MAKSKNRKKHKNKVISRNKRMSDQKNIQTNMYNEQIEMLKKAMTEAAKLKEEESLTKDLTSNDAIEVESEEVEITDK